jgi:hypothetical protein
MKLPKNLDLVLGLEDAQVLKAVNYGLRDVDSIHALTGIPRTIVNCKLNVLLGAGFVVQTDAGFMLKADAGCLIDAICGSY